MPGKKAATGFTEEERAAMKDRVREMKARSRPGTEDGEAEVWAVLAKMSPPDRALGERIHAIIRASGPTLAPKTWYGMPAYAKDGQVVCHFQPAGKFKTRYATIGFSDEANLDDGHMWPVAFALMELTTADESRIAELVRRAVG